MTRMRQVADALYQVQAGGHSVNQRLFSLMLNPPKTPELWEYEMDSLEGELWSLGQYCSDAKLRIKALGRNG